MIGLDTNVLLRLLVADDEVQFRKASAIVGSVSGSVGGILLTDVVLAETVRALRAAYRRSKEEILAALEALLAQPAFAFQDRGVVAAAVDAWRTGSADFSDYLIVARSASLGCQHTFTFDRSLRRVPGVKVVA